MVVNKYLGKYYDIFLNDKENYCEIFYLEVIYLLFMLFFIVYVIFYVI